MRIDAHHHIWDLTVRDQPWTAGVPTLRRSFPFEELRPSLMANAIDCTIVVQTVCVPEETPELLEFAATEPLLAGVVGWVDLTRPDVADQLALLQELRGGELLVGIRHQVQEEPDPQFLMRTDVIRGLSAVADAGLVYELLVRPHQLAAAVNAARSLGGVAFVLDHVGKPVLNEAPSPAWLGSIADLAELPNVTVKLSGLISDAPPDWTNVTLEPFVDAVLAKFGPERLMFGSDWPLCLLGGGYDPTLTSIEVLTAQLSERERRLVFGDVAASVYGVAP